MKGHVVDTQDRPSDQLAIASWHWYVSQMLLYFWRGNQQPLSHAYACLTKFRLKTKLIIVCQEITDEFMFIFLFYSGVFLKVLQVNKFHDVQFATQVQCNTRFQFI